jgi:hypothetical protein
VDIPLPVAPARSNLALWTAAIGAGFVLVISTAAQVLLWNGDTIFMLGWAQLIAAGFALVLSLHALFTDEGWRRIAPMAICVVVGAIVYAVPFRDPALAWKFARLKPERETVARAILAGKLRLSDDGIVQFDGSTVDGFTAANGAVLSPCGATKCVLFFTFQRSKFQPAEGFLYVPAGGNPTKFDWYGHYRTRPIGGPWYYAQED